MPVIIEKERKIENCAPSGSHVLLPSSSNRLNWFRTTDVATIRLVDASNTTFVYVRCIAADRDGMLVPRSTLGIHSSRQGPLNYGLC